MCVRRERKDAKGSGPESNWDGVEDFSENDIVAAVLIAQADRYVVAMS